MYMLKSLGNESVNMKVLVRLKRKIVEDINKIRQVNSLDNYTVNLTVYPLTLKSKNGEEFKLVKSNEWIVEKNLSNNFLKKNMKSLEV